MFKFKLKFNKFKLKGLFPKNLDDFEIFVKSCKGLNYSFLYRKEDDSGYLYLLVFGLVGLEFHFNKYRNFEYFTFSGTKFYMGDLKK